jgi:hypothetical protein
MKFKRIQVLLLSNRPFMTQLGFYFACLPGPVNVEKFVVTPLKLLASSWTLPIHLQMRPSSLTMLHIQNPFGHLFNDLNNKVMKSMTEEIMNEPSTNQHYIPQILVWYPIPTRIILSMLYYILGILQHEESTHPDIPQCVFVSGISYWDLKEGDQQAMDHQYHFQQSSYPCSSRFVLHR